MANLTDIANKLKETFENVYDASPINQESFEERYAASGGVAYIQIGNTYYVVINEVFEDTQSGAAAVSPLFYSSINDDYAIIDTKSSATLIDEVYSRITYMQRICDTQVMPDKATVQKSLRSLLGAKEQVKDITIVATNAQDASNKANIFQCFLVKDTGVSAVTDTYSFMLKDGEIKEIPGAVMNQIRRIGTVQLLKDSSELEKNSGAIQSAVFNKYANDDIDIQSVNVKSIFEIRMDVAKINLIIADERGNTGVFKTSYFAGKNNEFEVLNNNIHVCNSCGHDIVDIRDPSHVSHLHINSDAIDTEFSKDGNYVYAVGCEDCLEQCPVCGKWHFNYSKYINSHVYDKVQFKPGREFIRGLRLIEANYCSCREGIEWIYDDNSGNEKEHDIIPVEKMAFVNFANEKIASYEEYQSFYQRARRNRKFENAEAEMAFAKATLNDFKQKLANRFDMDDVNDVKITNADKCGKCSVCGGGYYGVQADNFSYRCDACNELISEKRRMVTRVDGVVFMRGKNNKIKKYVVTKLGNLKRVAVSGEAVAAKQQESSK